MVKVVATLAAARVAVALAVNRTIVASTKVAEALAKAAEALARAAVALAKEDLTRVLVVVSARVAAAISTTKSRFKNSGGFAPRLYWPALGAVNTNRRTIRCAFF